MGVIFGRLHFLRGRNEGIRLEIKRNIGKVIMKNFNTFTCQWVFESQEVTRGPKDSPLVSCRVEFEILFTKYFGIIDFFFFKKTDMWRSGQHSNLDLCLEIDSFQPILCGAEIHVGLGNHFPFQQVSVQIKKKEAPIRVPGTSIKSAPP